MNKYQSLNLASWIIIISAILMISYLSYLVAWPVEVVSVKIPIKVKTPEVERGGLLVYEYEYCKYMDAEIDITHQLVCDSVMRLDNQTIAVEIPQVGLRVNPGCGRLTKSIPIPMYAPVGECYVEEQIYYQINPLRNIHYTLPTERFNVVTKNSSIRSAE